MPTTLKTPGVYIEEISTLPASVAPVATAIPAFIGHTQKAEKRGEDLILKPTRVASLTEYTEYFGGAPESAIEVVLNASNGVEKVTFATTRYLYDSLQLFYANGGGPCYIVSVGDYAAQVKAGKLDPPDGLNGGLAKLEKVDEPTILLMPDAVLLGEDDLAGLQVNMIAQCNKLQDRVVVLDLKEDPAADPELRTIINNFRDKIGLENLKYGAAYAPWLGVVFPREVRFRDIELLRGANAIKITALTTEQEILNAIATLQGTIDDSKRLTTGREGITGSADKSLADLFQEHVDEARKSGANENDLAALFKDMRDIAGLFEEWRASNEDTKKIVDAKINETITGQITSSLKAAVTTLVEYEKGADQLIAAFPFEANDYQDFAGAPWDIDPGAIQADKSIYDVDENGDAVSNATTVSHILKALPSLEGLHQTFLSAVTAVTKYAAALEKERDDSLAQIFPQYKLIREEAQRKPVRIPPSGAIAGVYAKVDESRGVWKAPANVSLHPSVRELSYDVTHEEQEDFNVDVNAGKSVNIVRRFTGKGILVWGARTLAGNDNEWRYVNVRRFYNFVEESVKKATEAAVFEPNDKSTWVRLKAMITNFLTALWRDGALMGSKVDQAFYVKVGLGETMTPQDVLEGRMIVEIGLAVVRPAEFIILRFSHKLPEA